MTYDEFKNGITSIDKKVDEAKPKELSVIDDKFDEAKELFLKIYDEYINSEGFKEHLQKRKVALEKLNEAKKIWEETESFKHDPEIFEQKNYYSYQFVGLKFPLEDRGKFNSYEHYLRQLRGARIEHHYYSSDLEKYEMKITLLKKYLGVKTLPIDWYYNENCKG
jgi:hypothetical protein